MSYDSFVNSISGLYLPQEPPEFRGGIVADPMGLGKTLTMIALVATDQVNVNHNNQSAMPTLIVVPPPRE